MTLQLPKLSPNQAVRAFEVAEFFHDGQLDRQGDPYILHPLRVGTHFEDEIRRSIGFLHDVLEDTRCTEDVLRDLFIPRIVDGVVSVTKLPSDPGDTKLERYMSLIYRAAADPDGRFVKVQDIRDNLRPGYSRPDLRERYMHGLKVLM